MKNRREDLIAAEEWYRIAKEQDNKLAIEILENKFPKLKESEDEGIKKEILSFLKEGKPYYCSNSAKRQEWAAWVEKQGEQKPADKVKFKVGDWVVYDHRPYQVIELPEEGYINLGLRGNEKLEFAPSTYCRHWTIQDAKDGDVLCTYECCEPKIVFILKGTPKIHYALSYYCYYNIMYPHFGSDSEKGCLAPNDKDVKPATKEQRELLFSKLHEAGYEWDAEKKELKMIEQTSTWSEEDERLFQIVIDILDRENHLGNISHTDLIACVKKLKSLKERYTWKPSEEQMKALNEVLNYAANHENMHWNDYIFDTLNGLIKQLKNL